MKKLILIAALLIASYAAQAQTTVRHCKGITSKAQKCKSTMIIKGTDYCNAHNPAAIKCAGKNAKGKKCGMKVKKAGEFCRFHQEGGAL